ncbi:TlpA family protein disulfide reductase [Flagellimonas meishanensis]|uniref:TlpA family protein disulfide reductase n=1 Tax=Flagellimonas meishanensis TaxID=2873264 RepID=UPI00223AAD9C|nr:TlpA disulfide reductase family protein [[Muricauda] meishanensis]
MKLSKEQIGNGIWILVIVLIIFTPIGFHMKVLVNKIIAGSASTVPLDEQQSLKNYNWELIDLKGNGYNFESTKGKVVVLNFWATWCPPCVAELPSLDKLYADYGGSGGIYLCCQR